MKRGLFAGVIALGLTGCATETGGLSIFTPKPETAEADKRAVMGVTVLFDVHGVKTHAVLIATELTVGNHAFHLLHRDDVALEQVAGRPVAVHREIIRSTIAATTVKEPHFSVTKRMLPNSKRN